VQVIASVTDDFLYYAESSSCEVNGSFKCKANECFDKVVIAAGSPVKVLTLSANLCSGDKTAEVEVEDFGSETKVYLNNQWPETANYKVLTDTVDPDFDNPVTGNLASKSVQVIASVTDDFLYYAESSSCEVNGSFKCRANECFEKVVIAAGSPVKVLTLDSSLC